MRIGFIGLGSMGKGMAANLLKAGHEVRVWNRSQPAVEQLVSQGATAAGDPGEAFDAEVVISMLADDAVTRSVLIDSGALASSKPGLIHLSMATLSVEFIKELAALHDSVGAQLIAAPVFGRNDLAEAGKLNIAVGGPATALARVQPLLDVMGQKTWPMGEDPVNAAILKIATNMMLISAIEATGEAMALTQSYGVGNSDFVEFITNTLFAAPAYKVYGPKIAARETEGAGFTLRLGLKDVGLALKAGEPNHVPLPVASVLRDNLLDAVALGEGESDLAALGVRAIRRSGQE
ncbi:MULTISPECIES: NAD(P)-dependent oxidoreductase [Pseudomonas fluorescens group]|uniref:NAD(P)-dependent oxidoreductase n=1 Tax=Pseudomonas fluorescens group TaxID=136843 RepID=UPI00080ECAF6|nr:MULTISPECIES: NAD(P)-dependent oxidoreductase [Pseudomonas fluorescens group]UVL48674.1 NAD(P)-dependent oxidoreductase [Pseudomonas moraviensis]SDU36459.1 3-hydroxyisobutyrate dehydrogenase [Pseudomonas moraviensis]